MRQDLRQATATDGVFAANRSAGRIALTVASNAGVTRRNRVYEDGPLRVRFPNAESSTLEAVIVNTAGGIAGGDSQNLDIAVGPGAKLSVTTAAAEKVYRALGPASAIDVRLSVEDGASLAWLPQETILFDRAHLRRRIEVDLHPAGSLLIAEALVFGRAAMGETVQQGGLSDRWRVRRGGRLVFAETIRLDGMISEKLAEPAVAGGGIAVATVLVAPADDAMVERVRAIEHSCGEVGISAWNGLAVARLCAKDGAGLRSDLAAVLGALGAPLPRIWLQ